MNLNKLNMEELASYVCSQLDKKDIKVILSGGSCMELYTNALYSSYDIDFVMKQSHTIRQIESAMIEIGFSLEGKYYVLDESNFFVEILSPPVAVGDQFIKEFASRDTKVGTLKLLTATDCIKDRLCGCYLHNDKHCFEHALAVAHKNEIDINDLKLWAKNEDKLIQEGLDYFLKSLDLLENFDTGKISLYLLELCKLNYIDLSNDIGKQDLIDDLSITYVGKQLLNKYSNKDIFNFC
jgi:hypothetical protein